MASSKVMTSTSPPNKDRPRQCTSSMHHQQQHHFSTASHQHQHQSDQLLLHTTSDQNRSFGSMNMEEILKSIYPDAENCPPPSVDGSGAGGAVGGGDRKGKVMEEAWKEIVSGGASGSGGGGGREPEMTLEDFLTKAGAVNEEDVRLSVAVQGAPMEVPVGMEVADGFGVETMMNGAVQFQPGMHMQNVVPGGFAGEVAVGVGVAPGQLGFGNGMVAVGGGSGSGGGGVSRGAAGLARVGNGGGGRRKRTIDDMPIDRVSQQKQKRMIKNRESAARSRERKQAYTVELEALVTQLEEENARLLKEEVELNKQRYKQLMENLIPVIEKQRPPRVLRKVNSMSW